MLFCDRLVTWYSNSILTLGLLSFYTQTGRLWQKTTLTTRVQVSIYCNFSNTIFYSGNDIWPCLGVFETLRLSRSWRTLSGPVDSRMFTKWITVQLQPLVASLLSEAQLSWKFLMFHNYFTLFLQHRTRRLHASHWRILIRVDTGNPTNWGRRPQYPMMNTWHLKGRSGMIADYFVNKLKQLSLI